MRSLIIASRNSSNEKGFSIIAEKEYKSKTTLSKRWVIGLYVAGGIIPIVMGLGIFSLAGLLVPFIPPIAYIVRHQIVSRPTHVQFRIRGVRTASGTDISLTISENAPDFAVELADFMTMLKA